ncbi:MAG TPA: MEDS domain-containing protein [Candidatus Bathyarchaeia archaeon]|nr:MEDS domain-containing protein [Candidatus Bathyarchaeia archaeon]
MVLVIIREPLSYFRPYKNYFVAIYLIFNLYPISQLVLEFFPDDFWLRTSTIAFCTGSAIIATLWGLLVTKLYFYPEKFSLRTAITDPFKAIHAAYLVYLVPILALVVTPILDQGSIDTSPLKQAYYFFDATNYRVVGLSPLLISVAASVIISFGIYPFVILSRLRSELKDREVRNALRIIAASFVIISNLLFVGYSLSTFGYSILGATNLACVCFLIVGVQAFKKPTFLKAFLGVIPSLESYPTVQGDQTVLIYNSEDARLRPISTFVGDGLSRGNRVLYFHLGDETRIREELSRSGIDVKFHLTKGNLRLSSIDSLYQGENLFDEEAAINQCQEIASETRALAKSGLRIVIDYDDSPKRPFQRFVGHLCDSRWASRDHFVQVLMALTDSAFEGEKAALDFLKSKVNVVAPTESTDFFSRTVGLSHDEISGKKILLEYDPLSSYERILRSLSTEAVSNFERVILFTRKDSPVYSMMEDESGLKMFVLTSRVSYPKESGNVVLLPVYDSSLTLDALSKTVETIAATPFTVIFDNISHQIFTIGDNRAHSFVRQALELMVSNKITAIFLLNAGAHDTKTISTFESLFDMILICRYGFRVPEVRKQVVSLTVSGEQ